MVRKESSEFTEKSSKVPLWISDVVCVHHEESVVSTKKGWYGTVYVRISTKGLKSVSVWWKCHNRCKCKRVLTIVEL